MSALPPKADIDRGAIQSGSFDQYVKFSYGAPIKIFVSKFFELLPTPSGETLNLAHDLDQRRVSGVMVDSLSAVEKSGGIHD
jgi:hypothetical protein